MINCRLKREFPLFPSSILNSMSSNSDQSSVPSELKISKTWDLCIERAITRTLVGTLVGGMAAIVLFRKIKFMLEVLVPHAHCIVFFFVVGTPSRRLAFTTLGAGFGAGSAWSLSAIDFENEKKD